MSTTEIWSRIEKDLKKQASLQGYLPDLVRSFNSHQQIVFTNMNAKQKLTQLQSFIENELANIQNALKSQQIDLEAEEEPIEEQNSQQMQSQDEEEMQQDEEQDEDEELQEQAQANEQGEEVGQGQEQQEFHQPDFEKGEAMEQEDEEQNDEDQEGDDEQAFDAEDDVGLYGEELNDEDLENYDNQFDQEEFKEFQKEFGEGQTKKPTKTKKSKPHSDQQDNPDEHIEDNFDHFREIQLENQKVQVQTQPKTDLDNQIDRLETKIITQKAWTMKGQVKAKERPSNSLLQYDLQFSSGIKYSHEITEERNTELQELIKKRILTDMFDDRSRFVNTSHIREHFGSLKQVSREKSKMGLGEVYESQFKNFLGIGDNKNDKLKTQIMDSFKELNYFLDSLSNFSFVPKPTKDSSKKGQSQAIIVQEKVPLTLWNGQKQVQKDGKQQFESQKQVDNQAKRLKNKRIARQRKKEQIKKKLNKKIEYGGTTKFLAQAKQKAQMNNKPLKVDGVNMKYNKSASFFKNINENKGGKPNPDISKMKI